MPARPSIYPYLSAMLTLACLLAMAPPAPAGQDPSADNCAALGMLDVQCCQCSTGTYLGIINVQAGYDDWNKDCLRSKDEARSRCSGAYGVDTNDIGMKWKYHLGMTEWKNWNPRNNCPCAEW